MTQSTNQVETVRGYIVKLSKPVTGTSKNGGTYTISKFLLKLEDGSEIYASIYGDFDQNLVGSWVDVQGTWYNESNFNIEPKTEIVLVEGAKTPQVTPQVAAPVIAETTGVVRGRGRPSGSKAIVKAIAPIVVPVQALASKSEDRETYRVSAQEGVLLNLQSALEVLNKLEFTDFSVTDLVAVADMLGRTQTAIYLDHKNGR